MSWATRAVHSYHILQLSQGKLLVRKTLTFRNTSELGSVQHDPIGICRRNRRLLLWVQFFITWPNRNLPKKQTTVAVSLALYHVTRLEFAKQITNTVSSTMYHVTWSKHAEETDDYCWSNKHTTLLHSYSTGFHQSFTRKETGHSPYQSSSDPADGGKGSTAEILCFKRLMAMGNVYNNIQVYSMTHFQTRNNLTWNNELLDKRPNN
jgi:hypothetical protein